MELGEVRVQFRIRPAGRKISVDWTLGQELVLGSRGDVPVEGEGVSALHARLFRDVVGLHVEPVGDAHVTVNGNTVHDSMPVSDGDWLVMGSSVVQIRIFWSEPVKLGTRLQEPESYPIRHEPFKSITIGRLPECDLEIPSPAVSRQHARLFDEDGTVTLVDLSSTNGTFLNGRRINGKVRLNRGDRVDIAAFSFIFTGDSLEPTGAKGCIRLETRNLTKHVRDRVSGQKRNLLDDINIVVEPGEFAAIFGTSGSGKSTLIDALNGRRPATSGQVLYNGCDFYLVFDIFRTAVGYVPQQDIVHRKILVRDALRYTARLRLPPDTSDEEIDFHISRVLKQVGLEDKALMPIDTPCPLSGGQLKRVSLAVELIASPNILFLDEVTSGLDAGTDRKMMQLFADLGKEQKTIICVTHTLENIDVCDLILLLHHGKMIYFGPPKDANHYFGISRLSDVYELIESRPVDLWVQEFLQSSHYTEYIRKRSSGVATDYSLRNNPQLISIGGKSRSHSAQLPTLLRRYTNLLLADRRNLTLLFLQAALVAVLVGVVFDISGSPQARAASESQIGFLLVLSAIWCGCLNSTREVVKELPIYLRERAINLSIGPYLASKLIPLSAVSLLQCLALLSIVSFLTSWSGNFIDRLLTLFLASMAATCMGLAVSTLVNSNDKAVAFVPILLIPQVILSNFIVHLGKAGAAFAQVTIIAFSSFDAMKATLSLEPNIQVPTEKAFSINITVTAFLAIGFLLLAYVGLKLKDLRSR